MCDRMKRVLVVDDDRSVCRCLDKLIAWSQLGYEKPQIAYDGIEAMKIIETGFLPDVLITDVRMPMMSGTALAEKIREKYPEVQIIFFSAYEDFKVAQLGFRYGVKQYILKPINRNNLNNLEQLLREIASEVETKKKYLDILRESKDQENIYVYLYNKDLSYFEKLFGEFEKFTNEQAYSLTVLFMNVLLDFAENMDDSEVINCLRRMWHTYKKANDLNVIEWKNYLLKAYAVVCGQEKRTANTNANIISDKIKQCVLEHYGNTDLNISWIAERLNYTTNYISRLFCNETGIPLSVFIFETRMNKAAELLRDSQLDVTEIAKLVGYHNVNYFTKSFRKKMKTTPTNYRRSMYLKLNKNREEKREG